MIEREKELEYIELKMVLYKSVHPLFSDRPHVIEKWKEVVDVTTQEELNMQRPNNNSGSFGVLWYLFKDCIFYQSPITVSLIEEVMDQNSDIIKAVIIPHIKREFQEEETHYSINEGIVNETLSNGYLYTSMDTTWYLFREIIAKRIKKIGESISIIDNKGISKGKIEIRPHTISLSSLNLEIRESNYLRGLEKESLKAYDDVTADIFDIIAHLWIISGKNYGGFLDLHITDILRLRNIKERTVRNKKVGFRELDSNNVMKRLLALSNVWIYIKDGSKLNRNYSVYTKFEKLIEITEVNFDPKKKYSNALSVVSLRIKLLAPIMEKVDEEKQSIGVVDIKSIQYNAKTKKAHKRLTRYLSWQFKIRSVYRNYSQPFSILTLLRVIEYRKGMTGDKIKTSFEEVLDDLIEDKIISNWSYVDNIDENRVGKRGWLKDYWYQKKIIIEPYHELIDIYTNRKHNQALDLRSLINKMMELSLNNKKLIQEENRLINAGELSLLSTHKNIDRKRFSNKGRAVLSIQDVVNHQKETKGQAGKIIITPTLVKETRLKRHLSIRQASKLIGISHSTLSRYEKGEINRLNKKNKECLIEWISKN